MHRILIIDDEKNMRWAIRQALKREEMEIYEAVDGIDGVKMFKEHRPHLVLLDLRMPRMNGMEALEAIKEIDQEIPVIMMTAHGSTETAVKAMKVGAYDYVMKPFDVDELRINVNKALELRGLKQRVEYLEETLNLKEGKTLVGRSPSFQKVIETVKKVAMTDATVLIMGESGTGKELIADAIHFQSKRTDKAFIKVNCGAIPENLMESELFGYEKGAFTGATRRKPGRVEQADGGTLFLDEIGELPQAMQVKLLRVLQERELERVGGTETLNVDLRIVAATNQDLHKKVQDGSFREDLYYRLKVIPIFIPPLRERQEDLEILVQHFLEKYGKELNRKKSGITKRAMDALLEYRWPGNIRELENLIERVLILSPGSEIDLEDLPEEFRTMGDEEGSSPFAMTLPEEGISLDEMERNFILQALKRTDFNQTKAAKLLGITRHTLLYRMEKHKIEKEEIGS